MHIPTTFCRIDVDNPARAYDNDLRDAYDKLFQACLSLPRKLKYGCVVIASSHVYAPTIIMLSKSVTTPLLALTAFVSQANAISKKQWTKRADHLYLPKEVNDYKTATAPNNVTIRYKNPGICETTPGVDSYSGYVDLTPDVSASTSRLKFVC